MKVTQIDGDGEATVLGVQISAIQSLDYYQLWVTDTLLCCQIVA